MRLFSLDATHWYTRGGRACHTQVGRRGAARPTTVRDARVMALVPSVTNVLGVLAKPELGAWKLEQAVMAALTLPRRPGECLDALAARIAEDAESARRAAADFGTRFHEAAAQVAISPVGLAWEGELGPWVEKYEAWVRARVERVVWVEKTLVCPELGFAGTSDLLVYLRGEGMVLVDIKTQGNLKGAKVRKYSAWGYQLAAYRRALRVEGVRCMNLVVNASEAAAPVEVWWEELELEGSLEVFMAAGLIWRFEKRYDPRWVVAEKLEEEKEG